ncbi:hypothetical protein GXW77_08535 [Roseomonas alkaliterrae]|uniref:Uncharacterized protein n=1 Tax=Neoroseomonas alkaliterrae TaxID=1452450 RepID=A0A840XKX7_9PROT|nr:hypothetical protein [Neoroseomonas alkaliterrae]MBB5689265.1 hypothetical protein [Neoroseomonas alkaliterrae]MBR0676219.1 hypothetical protein [Neoroseomonas alkaliterrae]
MRAALERAWRRGQEEMHAASVDAARIVAMTAGEEKGAIGAARAEGALRAAAAIRRLPVRPFDAESA